MTLDAKVLGHMVDEKLFHLEAERDDARRETAQYRKAAGEWAAQSAALHGALDGIAQGSTPDRPLSGKTAQLFARQALTDTAAAAAQYQRVTEWRRIELGMVPLDKWITVGMTSSDSPTGWWEAPAKIYGLTGRDEEPSMLAFVKHYNGEELGRVYATHWKPYIAVAPKAAEPEGKG